METSPAVDAIEATGLHHPTSCGFGLAAEYLCCLVVLNLARSHHLGWHLYAWAFCHRGEHRLALLDPLLLERDAIVNTDGHLWMTVNFSIIPACVRAVYRMMLLPRPVPTRSIYSHFKAFLYKVLLQNDYQKSRHCLGGKPTARFVSFFVLSSNSRPSNYLGRISHRMRSVWGPNTCGVLCALLTCGDFDIARCTMRSPMRALEIRARIYFHSRRLFLSETGMRHRVKIRKAFDFIQAGDVSSNSTRTLNVLQT